MSTLSRTSHVKPAAPREPEAFLDAAAEHHHAIREIVAVLLLDADSTDRLVEDVIVRAYRRRDRFDPQHSFQAFILTLARELVRDRLQDPAAPVPAGYANYHAHLAARFADDRQAVTAMHRDRMAIEHCLRDTRPPIRRLIALRYEQGADYMRTARLLGRPVAAARQTLYRALTSFSARLVMQRGRST